MISLKSKRALVCGSTQGIGKAIAHTFAHLGAEVMLVARNEDKLQQVLSDLPRTEGQTHTYVAIDFQHLGQFEEKIHNLTALYPAFHILINNTGGPPPGDILTAKTETFSDAFTAHVLCNQILAQALVPGMKREDFGRIINIISTSVKQPIQGLGVSNTIRAAVANWAKTLATELAPHNITVNNILPGYTRTERLANIISGRAERSARTPGEIELDMLAEVPMGRFAAPEEVAAAAAFLASPLASYITGTNLPVDGGRILSL